MLKQADLRGNTIAYTITGNGNAIVLLHGFLESKAIWEDFTEKLCCEFTIIAIDLPGHGGSPVIDGTHTMQLMAETVKAVLDAESIHSTIIVGHSMGGYVALQFASDYPEIIKGLVLFHSHAAADSEQVLEDRRRTINIVKQNHVGFIRHFIPLLFDQKYVEKHAADIQNLQEQATAMSSEAVIAAISGMSRRSDQLNFLLLTEIPVLFIVGKQDSRIPFQQVLAQAVIPSHSEILILENVGHMGFIESAAKTLQALRHFALKCFENT